MAVRMPSDPVAAAFIKASGGFVSAPSANVSGRPSTTMAEHVIEDLSGKIDMILDGGQAVIGLESSIVDVSVDPPGGTASRSNHERNGGRDYRTGRS